MAKNLGYQFQNAIDSVFREKLDKHSLKGQQHPVFVWSYGERKNLMQISYEMKNYVRNNFPDIRQVKDISSNHWNSFLQEKSKTCGRVTLKNYESRISKMADIVNQRYKTAGVDWRGNVKAPVSLKASDIQRIQAMDPADFQKIRIACQNSTSRAAPAVLLASVIGSRVNELAVLKPSDINIGKSQITLHGKGGRVRTVSVAPQYRPFLQEIQKNSFSEKSVFGVKQNSINRFLNRTLDRLGLKAKYPQTSIHSVRKMVAQREWDRHREAGFSKKETMQKVSQFLGHGKDRYDIIRIYVGNRH